MIAGPRPGDDPIEAYLDELLAALRGTSRDVRRTLAECETHLRARAEALAAEGRSPADAARQAVNAFGPARLVAGQFNSAHRGTALRALAPAVAFQTMRLSAVGFLAIGVSGLLAWLLTLTTGTASVFADAPGVRFDPASCAHYLAVQQGAKDCAQAALFEARDDGMVQRLAAGLFGLVLLGICLLWQRRSRLPSIDLRTPAALVAVTAFGATGIGLTMYGVDRAIVNTGSGQWLSAGAVALVVAGYYLAVLWRRLTAPPFADA